MKNLKCSHLEGGRDVFERRESSQVAKHPEAAEHLRESKVFRLYKNLCRKKPHLDDDHGGAVADHFTWEEGKDEEREDCQELHSGSHPPYLGGPVDWGYQLTGGPVDCGTS